ncbi:dynamin family protein [Embleya sp. NPDC056575]|uniref:dynamin family protein n=1 Tax=unclassified Embleya TaxID=2699296 RepID=UPI0036B55EDC
MTAASGPAPGSTPPSPDDALRELAQATATLARSHGADHVACAALDSLVERWQSPQIPVVVVGEVSRGKSTLINALLGKEVLPSDFRAWTSTWVRVRHGHRPRATVFIRKEDGSPEAVEVAVGADLENYLTLAGRTGFEDRHGEAARVLAVQLDFPSPLLESGLELIDTPGVGGLEMAHLRATLSALTEADAVVFVKRPGEPVSLSERRFLARAVHRVSACLIVETHRDLVAGAEIDDVVRQDLRTLGDPAQWASVLDEDAPDGEAQRLAERFRSVDAVLVSARNALTAETMEPGPFRDRLMSASNIGALRDLLDDTIVARAHLIHRQNICGLIESLIQEVRKPLTQWLAMLRGDAAATRAIEERERRIARWVERNGDYWRQEYRAAGKRLLVEVEDLGITTANNLRRDYRNLFTKMRTSQIEGQLEPLLREPETAWAEMLNLVRTGTEKQVKRTLRALDSEGLGEVLTRMEQTKAVFNRLPDGKVDASSVFDPDDILKIMQGGMVTVGTTAVLAGVAQNAGWMTLGAAAPVFWPFLAGATLFIGVGYLRRRRNKTIEQAMEVVDIVCSEIRTTAVRRAKETARKARADVEAQIDAALGEERERIRRDRRELSQSATLGNDERDAAITKAEHDLRLADDLLARLTELRAQAG